VQLALSHYWERLANSRAAGSEARRSIAFLLEALAPRQLAVLMAFSLGRHGSNSTVPSLKKLPLRNLHERLLLPNGNFIVLNQSTQKYLLVHGPGLCLAMKM
jgi:hypothetical protein